LQKTLDLVRRKGERFQERETLVELGRGKEGLGKRKLAEFAGGKDRSPQIKKLKKIASTYRSGDQKSGAENNFVKCF